MTVQCLVRDLLSFVPHEERDSALRFVIGEREASGDHASVQACAAVLRERQAKRKAPAAPATVSTTWTDGEGEG